MVVVTVKLPRCLGQAHDKQQLLSCHCTTESDVAVIRASYGVLIAVRTYRLQFTVIVIFLVSRPYAFVELSVYVVVAIG